MNWHDERASEVESEVESAVADLDRPRVYLESGSSTGVGELTTFGAQSGSAMLLEKAGGENVVKEELAYPNVDWEWVVSEPRRISRPNLGSMVTGWRPPPPKTQ